MDDLTRKGKLAAAEAKKQLVCEGTAIHRHLEELVDRWEMIVFLTMLLFPVIVYAPNANFDV